MGTLLDWAGGAGAVVGIALCVVSAVTRLTGRYYFGGFDCEDLFLVGTAGMVFACLARVYRSSARSEGSRNNNAPVWGGEAPAGQGARNAHSRSIQATSNAAPRDGSPPRKVPKAGRRARGASMVEFYNAAERRPRVRWLTMG